MFDVSRSVIRCLSVGVCCSLADVRASAAQSFPAAERITGAIDGIVVDSRLVGIADANVLILGTNVRVVTAADGRFHFRRVPIGRYLLTVTRLGYQPATAALDVGSDTLRLSLTLERPTALDTVRVASTSLAPNLADFERRRQSGFGQFLTQAEIERHNSTFTTELIRTFRSIEVMQVQDHGAGPPSYYAVSRRSVARTCKVVMLVDNVLLPTPSDLDMLPAPSMIAGIEVYSGPATIPPAFAPYDRGCGVILIWTKIGT